MKPIWNKIGLACTVVSAIAMMTESLANGLIALALIAVVWLGTWLFENGKVRMGNRTLNVLKKVGTGIVAIVAFVYLGGMAGFAAYSVVKSSDWYGVIVVGGAGMVVGVLWYVNRWRRWWVKFLKTFMPEGTVNFSDWGTKETYYWTFDFSSNAQYGLLPDGGIFRGQATVWISPTFIDTKASKRLAAFENILKEKGITASCTLDHIPGCIYADISAETNYKKMNRAKQSAFRDAFCELDKLNYPGEYFVEYHGEESSILFACTQYEISRAVRTEPREEYFIAPECGFQSEEAHYFIERYPDWTEGTYRLITEEEFFDRWHKRTHYEDNEEAFEAFEASALSYFASVTKGDEKERANSQWDIENATNWLVAHKATDTMGELMCTREECAYWAARLFKDILPEEAIDTAQRIFETCEDTEICSRAQMLLEEWKKPNVTHTNL